jgi:NADH:ubiquinone oxidoreductase subunit
VLEKIFTWWSGATLGVLNTIRKDAALVGEDQYGNRYYQARTSKGSYDGRLRRWVIYKGYAEPTKIPPEWHAWMHYLTEEPPTVAPLKRMRWEREHLPNLTGTVYAWRPKGSIARGGERQAAPGDYQAWTPGE